MNPKIFATFCLFLGIGCASAPPDSPSSSTEAYPATCWRWIAADRTCDDVHPEAVQCDMYEPGKTAETVKAPNIAGCVQGTSALWSTANFCCRPRR